MINADYNPDVLTCLANLSNDEVFTPPTLVNQMLDLLPREIWSDSTITFLDPFTKTGVFLREIAKRLIKGLESEFPDQQERINHIFKNQLFGIAITELTSLLSRRSVYCTKDATSEYSIVEGFENEQGNIIFNKIKHKWNGNKCKFCGASKEVYDRENDLETHAYEFIHTTNPENIFKMRFDVIIGNPPYQLSDGGAQASAMPLYNLFVDQAKKLQPRYLSMIIPARWYSGGKGLNVFRDNMIQDKRITKLHDFPDSSDCFPGVEIKGGVCFFLWERDVQSMCNVITHIKGNIESTSTRYLKEGKLDFFIRYNNAMPILNKITKFNEDSFSNLVSSRKPFGIPTNISNIKEDYFENSIKIYANKRSGYINKDLITKNFHWISLNKILIPKAIGSGDSKTDIVKPIISGIESCCSETYLVVGPFSEKQIIDNVISYINTKFFHFLLTLKKNTQDATKEVYSLIPIQNFTEEWTDEKLYKKYNLTNEEIEYIENTIWPDKA
ncbi:Eco57I restriction-modification methylase domain-containing protein [Myroides odoratimimus]|uniref:Eco57I restriction-modification methylase domain-containing protein n=1 Tax=Myroides odoratimimus TaxID=76832 RepID=UPI0025768377|nr:Eco57I restriction-modification methylase domain-containing protein [Myroides odoratimimus]MDM1528898.1 Eco57I restriction-modification methylase domain-containing protein [Myroides odoratimimus]